MPLINHSIPNLINGVSQQSESLRLGSQAESQTNGIASVVEGLKKRTPSEFIKKVSSSTLTNPFIHTINRDSNERYIVIITTNDIEVYGIDGTQYTVNKPSGTAYLNESNAKDTFEALTVADNTFIINKNKTVAMDSAVTAARPFEAVYSVLQGVTQTEYNIIINGTTYTYTTTNTPSAYQTTEIVDQLVSQIGSLSGFTITDLGSDIHFSSASDFTIKATDGFGNQASQVIKGSAQKFSDLPTKAVNGFEVEITGDNSNAFDNYYVKYVSGGNNDEGFFQECQKSGLQDSLDVATLPHLLIRQADGNFRFTPANGHTYTISGIDFTVSEYGSRVVGDLTSAPEPSFVGQKMSDIFFHRNRLGFIAGEAIVMSRAGEFFKFFPETVTTILDSDPIDVNVSHVKVSNLRHAIPFDEKLLLFSDQTQFVMSGANILTPSNIVINATTEFESSLNAKPVSAGRNVFFAFNKGSFTGMREYYVDADSDTNDADDITAAVPKYIPKNVFKLAIATNENFLAVLSSDEQNALYCYQWYIANNQKLQSAWHKFTYGAAANTTILNCDFIETDLFLLVQRTDGVHIVKQQLAPAIVDTDATYLTHLDMKVNEATTGLSKSYNAGTNQTTITLPYTIYNDMQVVTRNVSGSSTIAGQIIVPVSAATGQNTVVLTGDQTSTKFFIGEKYTFEYEFSQQYLALGGGQRSRTNIKEGRLQIRNWSVGFDNSGHFKVQITPKNRSTTTEVFNGAVVGEGTVNGVNLEDGNFKFAIQSRNEGLVVKLTNDEYLPSHFVNAEWQGFYNQTSSQNT